MSVHVQLDRPYAHFTNLDFITGKVVLTIFREETLSAIVIKLEGESRTRLASPSVPGQRGSNRSTTQLEVHKILYRVDTVFPSPDLQQATPNSTYTLNAGQHEFPFQFKIPFNNACSTNNSLLTNLNIMGARMEMARDTNMHMKRPLPPSLSGFPGEAEIRYYIKATAQRPAFYKENFRANANFKFLPIEPPRQIPSGREAYARRKHQFQQHGVASEKSGLFRKPSTVASSTPAPLISIDGRLPDPAIITCNEPLPLRVIIKKLNDTTETIFLKLFQVELIGYTRIRAHELQRLESSSWVIISAANLQIPLGDSNTPAQKDMEIDNNLWRGIALPNTVPPSFETCNLSRYYELEVRIGLAYGTPGNVKPELTVQALRLPVDVYSGIAPPPALLAEMEKRGGSLQAINDPEPQTNIEAPAFSQSQPQSAIPVSVPASSGPTNAQQVASVGEGVEEPPPPSYEDAMADDLAPVDGPRRDYDQPPLEPVVDDVKRRGAMSRLFP